MGLCYGEDYDMFINIKEVSDIGVAHLTMESEWSGRAHNE